MQVINLIHFKLIVADMIAYIWMDDIVYSEWFEIPSMR